MGFGANNVSCPQRQMLLQSVVKSGLATPVLSGSCANFMSVVANGVGDYTISLLKPYYQLPEVMLTAVTDDRLVKVGAITNTSVQVLVNDLAGAPAHGDFHALIIGSLAVDLLG